MADVLCAVPIVGVAVVRVVVEALENLLVLLGKSRSCLLAIVWLLVSFSVDATVKLGTVATVAVALSSAPFVVIEVTLEDDTVDEIFELIVDVAVVPDSIVVLVNVVSLVDSLSIKLVVKISFNVTVADDVDWNSIEEVDLGFVTTMLDCF